MMGTPLTLSTATANWVRDKDDNQWVIRDQEGNELWKLPARLSDYEAMQIIHFGRKYELEAFNRGVEFGKQTRDRAYLPKIESLQANIKALAEENERISAKLEQMIIGVED